MGHQLASANASHVFDTITISTASTPNSLADTTLNQYGIRVEDETGTPPAGKDKLNIVMLTMQHSSEDQGEIAAWEFVHFFVSGTGIYADWLRNNTRLYIYSVNVTGRYYGAERHTIEDGGGEDPNRAWDDTGSEQVENVKSAISTDVSRVDILFDWHGSYELNGNGLTEEFLVYRNSTAGSSFATRANTALSTVSVASIQSTTLGTGRWYGDNTLSAQLSVTLENPIAAPNLIAPLVIAPKSSALWAMPVNINELADVINCISSTTPPVAVRIVSITCAAPPNSFANAEKLLSKTLACAPIALSSVPTSNAVRTISAAPISNPNASLRTVPIFDALSRVSSIARPTESKTLLAASSANNLNCIL